VVRNPAVLFAFLAIYILWGSTYLAIRLAVAEIPPLLAAGIRFAIAGAVVYGWARLRGSAAPTKVQLRNVAVLACCMFLIAYGTLFWAETKIDSGIASVLVASISIWTVFIEALLVGKIPAMARVFASGVGLAGVAVISLNAASRSGLMPCLGILVSSLSWSIGTVLSKRLDLPEAKTVAAGLEMLLGGVLLLTAAAFAGEYAHVQPPSFTAISSLIYLIVAGSILAFTSYLYLLSRMPASSVASYAYVNPVVALLIGASIGHESIGSRTLFGTGLVLLSVLLILTLPARELKKATT
jgi:drug/metabolite transporter (DMT)-like permease